MKTKKESSVQESKLDWSKINVKGPGYEEKMARAKEAVQVEGLAELIAEVRAAQKQKG